MNHEEDAIRAFILPARRDRYLGFLGSAKGRAKLIAELPHFKALDPSCLLLIPPNQKKPKDVHKTLTSMGAGPKCWIISENRKLDGKEMDLEIALQETIGYQMGTIISCVPGKLGYFEDEESRYILRR
jgi:hypothetical protein